MPSQGGAILVFPDSEAEGPALVLYKGAPAGGVYTRRTSSFFLRHTGPSPSPQPPAPSPQPPAQKYLFMFPEKLCYVVLCCVVLWCGVLCCVVVWSGVVWCGVVWCVVWCVVLCCVVLWCVVVCCVERFAVGFVAPQVSFLLTPNVRAGNSNSFLFCK